MKHMLTTQVAIVLKDFHQVKRQSYCLTTVTSRLHHLQKSRKVKNLKVRRGSLVPCETIPSPAKDDASRSKQKLDGDRIEKKAANLEANLDCELTEADSFD